MWMGRAEGPVCATTDPTAASRLSAVRTCSKVALSRLRLTVLRICKTEKSVAVYQRDAGS
jgi:hypothetical protein